MVSGLLGRLALNAKDWRLIDMTTFPLGASDMPDAPTARLPMARIAAALAGVIEVFAEAEQQANAAHRRLTAR